MPAFLGRVPIELDPYTDVPGSAMTDFDRSDRLQRYAEGLTRQVHAVELAAHQLQGRIDTEKLALMTDSRAEVIRVRDTVAGVFDDLLAALSAPEAQRERLLDRLRGR